MTLFILLSILLVAVVLALLLWPLLARTGGARPPKTVVSNAGIYREQLAEIDAELEAGIINREQWELARSEIERRVLDDGTGAGAGTHARSPRVAIAIAIAVPFLAGGLYALLGNPNAFSPMTNVDSAGSHSVTPDQVEAMLTRLAERLKEKPDDTEGWIMLGRSKAVIGRFEEAAVAFRKAVEQRPRDAQLLADFADVLAMAKGQKLEGEPTALLKRALAIDPDNVKALSISGTAAFDRGDFTGAANFWKRALALVPPESEYAQRVRSSIAEAENHSSPSGKTAAAPAAATSAAAATAPAAAARAGASLSGRISLAAGANAKVDPEDTVFVFARPAEGQRMPLAILRRKVKDLPFDFSLDDSMAMSPNVKVSDFKQVVVVARISKSGQAVSAPGDLEVASATLAPGSKGIKLELAGPSR